MLFRSRMGLTFATALLQGFLATAISVSLSAQTVSAITETDLRQLLLNDVKTHNLVFGLPASLRITAELHTFTSDGVPDGVGNFELLANADGRTRQTLTYRDVTQIIVRSKTEIVTSNIDTPSSLSEVLLIRALLGPFPARDYAKEKLKVSPLVVGNVSMDCATPRSESESDIFCYGSDARVLRIWQTQNNFVTFFDNITKVSGITLGRTEVLKQGTHTRGTLRITSISSWTPDESAFELAGDVLHRNVPAAKVELPKPIAAPIPSYPHFEQSLKKSGIVVIRFIVTREGRTSDLEVVESNDEEFSKAALEALSHWTFRPLMIDGVPYPQEMFRAISFSMGESESSLICGINKVC
jgi:TonB family protein